MRKPRCQKFRGLPDVPQVGRGVADWFWLELCALQMGEGMRWGLLMRDSSLPVLAGGWGQREVPWLFLLNMSHVQHSEQVAVEAREGTYLTFSCSGSLTHPSCSKRIR